MKSRLLQARIRNMYIAMQDNMERGLDQASIFESMSQRLTAVSGSLINKGQECIGYKRI